MAWDPFSAWPRERPWIWAALAVLISVQRAPAAIENFWPHSWRSGAILPDFFQEWSSARMFRDGLPVYTSLATALERYISGDVRLIAGPSMTNAHPPTSVLLAMPLASLDFDTAFFIWNLISIPLLILSLWLIVRGLAIKCQAWAVFPATTMLILCSPLQMQIRHGQLSLLLLSLICGAWFAERSGQPRVAGVLLGAAAAIKFFPAFMLVYFAVRRRWTVVSWGAGALALLFCLTAVVLGWQTCLDYVRDVLPNMYWFRVNWGNNSLAGFWCRIFDPAPWRKRDFSLTKPLLYSPTLASLGHWVSSATVAAITVLSALSARTRHEEDQAFAVAVIAMLLISPITWDHYFLLLLLPLAIQWLRTDFLRPSGWVFGLVVLCMWVEPVVSLSLSGLNGRVAGPLVNLTVLSYQFYALLALFGLSAASLIRLPARPAAPDLNPRA
jgi:Glycosyltransferase family 87